MDIGEDPLFRPAMAESGINSATLSEEILCAAERLLDVMERPLDARILGKQIIREMLYHVLTGPRGGALRALVSRQTHFSPISRVLKRIESQYTETLSVDQLAAEANMSLSAFHHNFKSVTSTSPGSMRFISLISWITFTGPAPMRWPMARPSAMICP